MFTNVFEDNVKNNGVKKREEQGQEYGQEQEK